MHVEYALEVLKEKKISLVDALESKEVQDTPRLITKFKHQIYSLDFAIELLETWED
jgi:hypothetical protein